jgi:choline dehydrogenase-like flavoprotein
VRDYFGSPAPHIHCGLSRYERKALGEAKDAANNILTAMGLSQIRSSGLSYAGHQMGTHRMGTDPATSVVDVNLRCHEVPNLYLLGSGCFVTGSASPPTLTIAALAIRAAEHIAATLRPPGQSEPTATPAAHGRPQAVASAPGQPAHVGNSGP